MTKYAIQFLPNRRLTDDEWMESTPSEESLIEKILEDIVARLQESHAEDGPAPIYCSPEYIMGAKERAAYRKGLRDAYEITRRHLT